MDGHDSGSLSSAILLVLVQMQLGRTVPTDSDQPVRMLVLRYQVASQVNLHFSHRRKIGRLLLADCLSVFECDLVRFAPGVSFCLTLGSHTTQSIFVFESFQPNLVLGLLAFHSLPLLSSDRIASLLQVGDILGLALGFRLQFEPRPRLNRTVVHRLECVAGAITTINNPIDLIADTLGTYCQVGIGFQFVEAFRPLLELLKRFRRDKVDHVSGYRVNEIGDGIVRLVKHRFDIGQLKKDHYLCSQECIVGGSHIFHVMIHLIGNGHAIS